jgi:hypothetical protein
MTYVFPPESLALAFAIFVWLKTNAFVDFFGWALKKKNILYVRDYFEDDLKKVLEYPLWLYVKKTNFLTKLISCPLCLSFWCSFFFFSGIMNWLANAFLTLLWFSILDKLYKQK